MPRIETTQHAGSRPRRRPSAAEPGQMTLRCGARPPDGATRCCARRRWAAGWARRDPRGFDQAVRRARRRRRTPCARAAAAVPPARARRATGSTARELLGVGSGPGAQERLLARIALEWAAAGAAPATDALFALRRRRGSCVQAGGADALARSADRRRRPARRACCSTPIRRADDPFERRDGRRRASRVCADFEDEAQRTAAHRAAALERGAAPVALIAQDRLLVRRVRALL